MMKSINFKFLKNTSRTILCRNKCTNNNKFNKCDNKFNKCDNKFNQCENKCITELNNRRNTAAVLFGLGGFLAEIYT